MINLYDSYVAQLGFEIAIPWSAVKRATTVLCSPAAILLAYLVSRRLRWAEN